MTSAIKRVKRRQPSFAGFLADWERLTPTARDDAAPLLRKRRRGDQRRPATLTRQTLRATAGDTTGHPTTPGKVAVYSGRKQTPIPAATIVRIQSSRSL